MNFVVSLKFACRGWFLFGMGYNSLLLPLCLNHTLKNDEWAPMPNDMVSKIESECLLLVFINFKCKIESHLPKTETSNPGHAGL